MVNCTFSKNGLMIFLLRRNSSSVVFIWKLFLEGFAVEGCLPLFSCRRMVGGSEPSPPWKRPASLLMCVASNSATGGKMFVMEVPTSAQDPAEARGGGVL